MMQSSITAHSVWKRIAIPRIAWSKSILGTLGTHCQSFSESRPRAFLLCAVILGLVGFACLLLFPFLAVLSGHGLYEALFIKQTIAWNNVLAWLVLCMFSILISYRIYRYRPALPAGSILTRDAYPLLHQLVGEQLGHYCSTRVDRIVVTNEFEIDILKTPKWALPIWSTNTLVIGLPLIHCLSASQFQCALARRLGQFSKRYNWLENWIYQLREIWPQYCASARKCGLGFQPVGWFFMLYAPVYKVITIPVARLDELAADKYAMELFNDEEVLDTITTQLMCDRYLAGKPQPVLKKTAAYRERAFKEIYFGMITELRSGLQGEKHAKWLAKTLSVEEQWGDIVPSLARRVESLGHTHYRIVTNTSGSAASVYLGTALDDLTENAVDSNVQEQTAVQG